MTPLVAARDLEVIRGGGRILYGVSLAIGASEIVTVVGPNGSGKSTLLRCLIGAIRPDGGTVVRREGLRIGYVPQSLAIDATLPMTVRRFLDLPRRAPEAEARAALARAGVEGLGARQMVQLSGGQRQRVLLARAILGRPELLILDEPTQGLDQPGAAQFYRLIEDVRTALGCAVLMVSHELHVVMSASDRVICLNGHVCCEGTPEIVSAAPAYRALFGTGTQGALALYRHDHDHHHHAPGEDHSHAMPPGSRDPEASDSHGKASRSDAPPSPRPAPSCHHEDGGQDDRLRIDDRTRRRASAAAEGRRSHDELAD